MSRKRALVLLAFLFCDAAVLVSPTFAVWPLPPYSAWPCENGCPSDPDDCYSFRAYGVKDALQVKGGERSSRSTQKPQETYGICPGLQQWCQKRPELGGASADVVQSPGGGQQIVFNIPYDFPDNYCQLSTTSPECKAGAWPPKQTLSTPVTMLTLLTASGNLVALAPAVFESGVWMPRVNAGCGPAVASFRVMATNGGEVSPFCGPEPTATAELTVVVPASPNCQPDRRGGSCGGGVGNQGSAGGGKPISFGSGNVSLSEPLFTIDSPPLPLRFAISYHSAHAMYPGALSEPMGTGWTHSFNSTLRAIGTAGRILYRVDGEGLETQLEGPPNGPWVPGMPAEHSTREQVVREGGTHVLRDLDGTAVRYDVASGRWLSTTDRWGNALIGSYDAAGALVSVSDGFGRAITLGYSSGRLASVVLPTGETWRFAYEGNSLAKVFDPLHTGAVPWRTYEYVADDQGVPRLLAAARDESGALLEGHTYDAQNRGLTSYSEGGREQMSVTYLGSAQRRVTTALDGTTSQQCDFTMRYQGGRWLTTKIAGTCASCGASSDEQSLVLDSLNRVTSRTDGTGHVTRFSYDRFGNVASRTEAFGTSLQRTTSFAYEDPAWPSFATRIASPSAARPGAVRVTAMSWSAGETVLTASESGYLTSNDTAPTAFASTRTFDARHRPVASDGPRTDVADVMQRAYYPDDDPNVLRRGRLRQRADAAGLARGFDDYDVYGNVRTVTDENGVVTTSVTDARGRVIAATNEAVAGDPEETGDYTQGSTIDGRDRLLETLLPRGNRTRYIYQDGSNRLTDVIRLDGDGNEVERRHLTLNLAGERIEEEDQVCELPSAVCGSWVTRRSERSVFDNRNRLAAVVHPVPEGSRVAYTYDADGKVSSVADENHVTPNTSYTYDALERLVAVTQTLATSPGGVAITRYGYDAMDHLTSVTDANGNVTAYAYDDFGRLRSESSPVSGVTTHSHDPAGNVVATSDARGAVTRRIYDALGRLLAATSGLGGEVETVTLVYDDPTPGRYGLGRLVSMSDPSGTTSFAYERRGLLREEVKTILGDVYTTRFRYDDNGNRSGITYPSGRTLTTGYDFADRPVSLTGTLGAATTTYVSRAAYEPFGPERSLVYGGGAGLLRQASFDSRYRLAGFEVSAGDVPLASYGYGHDAVGNVTAITDRIDSRFNRAFGYDDLHRLTGADGGVGLWGTGSYSYDAIGNRTAAALGTKSSSYAYVGTTSKLESVTDNAASRAVLYDEACNERQVGAASFVYSPRNHLASGDGLRYVYDGSGLRVAQAGLSVGPLISRQPASQPVCPGASATLAVVASGASGYQWQAFDGASWSDIPAATSPSVMVTPTGATQYRVVVANAAASTTSNAATVTPVAIATEPASGIHYGDLDHDGSVDGDDVAALRQVLAGNQTLGVPTAVANLNGDGKIDALDLALLGAFAGQRISCLPQLVSPVTSFAAGTAAVKSAATVGAKQAAPNPTRYFFYSREKALLSLTELRAGGGMPQIAVDYIWFGGRPIAEERVEGGGTRYTLTDHLGTPFLQTDTSAVPVWRAEYEPYGAVFRMRAGEEADQRLRFPGQEYDEQTPGREYNIYRWYETQTGRYTSQDPLGIRPLYAYADNQPVLQTDALGLFSIRGDCKAEDCTVIPTLQQCENQPSANCGIVLINGIRNRALSNGRCRRALRRNGVSPEALHHSTQSGALEPGPFGRIGSGNPFPVITCDQSDCRGTGGEYQYLSRTIPLCSQLFAISWEEGERTMMHEFLHEFGVGDGTERQRDILRDCYGY